MNLTEKAAYIKGLADGLDFDKNSAEGKLLAALIDLTGDLAEYVAELVGACVELKKKDGFNPNRMPMHWFSDLSVDEKNEVIKSAPEYGRIICRCELVTEGEILYAIRTNPKPRDVDGVKRRTRATMGRCQGGFCSPYIVELLANEMGCDYGDITKFGGKSIINVGKTKEV